MRNCEGGKKVGIGTCLAKYGDYDLLNGVDFTRQLEIELSGGIVEGDIGKLMLGLDIVPENTYLL